MILEFDWACLERKFAKCVAHCTFEGVTKWRWINMISEEGRVFFGPKGDTVGSWVTQIDGHRDPDYPVVEFHYTPIPIGWMHTDRGIAMLMRRHAGKIFKVGFDYDGYTMTHLLASTGVEELGARFYNVEFKPDMGVYNRELGKRYIFSPYLWTSFDSLMYLNQEIGFVEEFKCFLLDKSFHPVVKPYLGEQWQIVS